MLVLIQKNFGKEKIRNEKKKNKKKENNEKEQKRYLLRKKKKIINIDYINCHMCKEIKPINKMITCCIFIFN